MLWEDRVYTWKVKVKQPWIWWKECNNSHYWMDDNFIEMELVWVSCQCDRKVYISDDGGNVVEELVEENGKCSSKTRQR